MNAPTPTAAERNAASDVSARLAFFRGLQSISNRIHATPEIDGIMLELSQDLCELFNADRLTIYAVSSDGGAIISKFKTGLNSFKDLRLPLSDQSVAGYVARHKVLLNIRDVYDKAELRAHSADLRFLQEVDKRTGYRTREMLAAPVLDEQSADLLGVVQLINNKAGVPFTAVMEEGVQVLCQTLAIAFAYRQKLPPARSKYDALIEDAVISAHEFEEAAKAARSRNLDIEEVLVRDLEVKLPLIGQALAKFFGVPYEPFKPDRIKPIDLLRNLKREYVEEARWLPAEETNEGIFILTTDPEQVKSARIVANIFPKATLHYRVTTHREFAQAVDQFFGSLADNTSVTDLLSDLHGVDDEADEGADLNAASDNELVKLVNKVIVDAYRQGASDIHIEPRPGKDKTLIRFRRDGALVPYIEVPASYRSALVTRIKIMCDLDISERRKPQDGKIKFKKYGPLDLELRVATLPSAGGVEDVVMRILQAGEPVKLDALGVLPHNLERLKSAIEKPYGIFFVCGPTGSGKTTTLHSILSHINTPETKIWTAEDPVEITQRGLRQVQMNRKAGLDFATAMRAFLRADPDVIMVGEMRDRETVAIGIEASLTGHLVLSTLHTNSAPESVIRLLDMGMDPFNFADALLGILAQRLAKRLCQGCRQAYHPEREEVDQLMAEYCEELRNTESWRRDPKGFVAANLEQWKARYADGDGRFTLYRPVGCNDCGGSGYKGRLGLHELLVGSDAIKALIQERARVSVILAAALEEGMRTLRMDGIEKVLAGLTDMKQVRKVCIK